MKMNLKVSLPAVVMMLLMVSLTGYAHGVHDKSTENQAIAALEDSTSVSAKESLISRWLETRLAEELAICKASSGEYAIGAAWISQDIELGGGWCDRCGCWFSHGCDPNGNCEIGHRQACSGPGPYCDWHGNCFSS